MKFLIGFAPKCFDINLYSFHVPSCQQQRYGISDVTKLIAQKTLTRWIEFKQKCNRSKNPIVISSHHSQRIDNHIAALTFRFIHTISCQHDIRWLCIAKSLKLGERRQTPIQAEIRRDCFQSILSNIRFHITSNIWISTRVRRIRLQRKLTFGRVSSATYVFQASMTSSKDCRQSWTTSELQNNFPFKNSKISCEKLCENSSTRPYEKTKMDVKIVF
ncbi:unnamed protein product [Albugo candida]|uniref:Uncharacterized protein n=1 Tax=Albugo candida TaxID=65357 RepID=A0A024G254_9STRA|nr:unnamed protein product [Albugo candida]|eukprot:CCI40373.1 unnamed protein product [Albugo candida]